MSGTNECATTPREKSGDFLKAERALADLLCKPVPTAPLAQRLHAQQVRDLRQMVSDHSHAWAASRQAQTTTVSTSAQEATP
jgi:hypothetical protein